ncbi:PREDICTED: uncharacterized protein LOC101299315 [Fragaria vesca subsp. vesca]|uniref:uncharacterized protein LOC101299315 n=1 Tax=Fragaria vesca subsp. vesca TaxID=101020 RepID=UPI0002C33AD0|nr:PREDICTED: uncharacterized protein LOC101299315 [Fragaria vesca subsp. vesca]
MTVYLRRKADLDLEDRRLWERPRGGYREHLWDQGLVSVSYLEYFGALTEKLEKEGIKAKRSFASSVEQKQSSWYRPHLPGKRLGYHPYCTMGVHTKGSHAQPCYHSAGRSCNSCGVTHWRQHCPLNCDQGVPETAPK